MVIAHSLEFHFSTFWSVESEDHKAEVMTLCTLVLGNMLESVIVHEFVSLYRR